MMSKIFLGLVIASLTGIIKSQNTTLVDPRTRFSNLNLSLPAQAWPVLQGSFETPPDCGETSYVGRGRLQGRRALITGGDSGIGRAVVIAFAREGANIAINYMEEEEPDAQDLADFLAQEGLNFTRIPGDLLNETFCADLVQRSYDTLGGLDILVSNAGYPGIMSGPDARSINNLSTSQFDKVFRTNVYAPFFITRAAVSLMPPGSALLYTASNVARLPPPNGIDYSASKAAIVSFVRSLSVQLAPQGLRVAGVAPGLTFSPMLPASGQTTDMMSETTASFPFERVEQPAELSPVYVDLAAADNTFSSGTIWGVTGAQQGF